MSASAALKQEGAGFVDLPQRDQARRLGVLLFIASEGLLFGGLFALYAAYRAHYPSAFAQGVRDDLRWDGTLNTIVLLVAGSCAAVAVARLHEDARLTAVVLLRMTGLLGIIFLALKGYEYAVHLRDGIFTGGRGRYFDTHTEPGLAQFFDLYWLMTGLHALHVMVGIAWIGAAARRARGGRSEASWVGLAAMYWHFVDLIWVFLWPLFYLLGGGF